MNVGFLSCCRLCFFDLLHSLASVIICPFGFSNVVYFYSYYYVVEFFGDVRLYAVVLIIIIYYEPLHALDIGLPMTSSLTHTSYSNTQIT